MLFLKILIWKLKKLKNFGKLFLLGLTDVALELRTHPTFVAQVSQKGAFAAVIAPTSSTNGAIRQSSLVVVTLASSPCRIYNNFIHMRR
jgi:hypothetical protein